LKGYTSVTGGAASWTIRKATCDDARDARLGVVNDFLVTYLDSIDERLLGYPTKTRSCPQRP